MASLPSHFSAGTLSIDAARVIRLVAHSANTLVLTLRRSIDSQLRLGAASLAAALRERSSEESSGLRTAEGLVSAIRRERELSEWYATTALPGLSHLERLLQPLRAPVETEPLRVPAEVWEVGGCGGAGAMEELHGCRSSFLIRLEAMRRAIAEAVPGHVAAWRVHARMMDLELFHIVTSLRANAIGVSCRSSQEEATEVSCLVPTAHGGTLFSYPSLLLLPSSISR